MADKRRRTTIGLPYDGGERPGRSSGETRGARNDTANLDVCIVPGCEDAGALALPLCKDHVTWLMSPAGAQQAQTAKLAAAFRRGLRAARKARANTVATVDAVRTGLKAATAGHVAVIVAERIVREADRAKGGRRG